MYRYGVPKTEEERLASHLERYGSSELPSRGTGRTQAVSKTTLVIVLLGLGLLFLSRKRR